MTADIIRRSKPDSHSTFQPCNPSLHPIHNFDRTSFLVSKLFHADFSDELSEPRQSRTAKAYYADVTLPHQSPGRLNYPPFHLNSRAVQIRRIEARRLDAAELATRFTP